MVLVKSSRHHVSFPNWKYYLFYVLVSISVAMGAEQSTSRAESVAAILPTAGEKPSCPKNHSPASAPACPVDHKKHVAVASGKTTAGIIYSIICMWVYVVEIYVSVHVIGCCFRCCPINERHTTRVRYRLSNACGESLWLYWPKQHGELFDVLYFLKDKIKTLSYQIMILIEFWLVIIVCNNSFFNLKLAFSYSCFSYCIP